MTDFRQTLKKRIFWMRAFTGTVFAIIMLGLLNEFMGNVVSLPTPQFTYLKSFQTGFLISIEAIILILYRRYRNALRNQDKLELLYNIEHDERKIMIRHKAGVPVMLITSAIILLAAIVAGYFNETVFYLKKYRIAMGISQEAFADKCGMHRTYISAIECYRRSISLENIQRIADALEIETYKLFIDDERKRI